MTEQPDQQPYATRRESPGAYETRRDAPPAAYETRRDAAPPVAYETRRDEPPGRHRAGWGGTGQDTASLLSLPPELAARYTAVGELPDPGTEADILRVVDRTGTELVVKLYRRGIRADRGVWETLSRVDCPQVIRFVETGTASGRDYECMDYLSGGNLTALVDPPGTPLPARVVTEVVRQVAAGLSAVHEHSLLHRDLKPENILVRRRHPLELVVTDFGLGRILDKSVMAASRSGTQAYFAPELVSYGGGSQSRARDWWALGLIARELLIGRRTFDDLRGETIAQALAVRDIDLSEVEDPRMRLLCAGLLTRDPEDRWGAAQVTQWLDGDSPAVVRAAQGGGAALPFLGRTYTGRPQLARALAANWEQAARRYFAAMGSDAHPSEGWGALRTWLASFTDLAPADLEAKQELIDERLRGSLPPDVKLLHLLRWLEPVGPPTYRGLSVAPQHVSDLAGAAVADPQAPPARAVGDLWRYDLLPILAEFSAGGPLRDIHTRWHELHAEWKQVDDQLCPLLPPAAAGLGGTEEAALLALAADPAEAGRLQGRAAAGVAALPIRLAWLDQVLRRGGQSPLAAVTVLRVLPEASRESHEIAAQQAAQRAEREARQRRWADREATRRAGADAAQSRAFVPLIGWSVVMVLLSLMAISTAAAWVAAVSFLCAAVAAAVAFWSELGLVNELGADYAGYSIGSRVGPLFSRFRARGVGAGPGCALVIGVLFGIGLLLQFPPVLFGVIGGWHYSTVLERRRLWQAQHQQDARNAGVAQ